MAPAPFTTLPAELVADIVGRASEKADLINLLCVASFFIAHVLPSLYRNISIESLPDQPDQAASDLNCLQRLYSVTSILMRPQHQEKASLVRAFSFEAYMGSDVNNEERLSLPHKRFDSMLANAIRRGTIFHADSSAYLAQGNAHPFEDPACADYMLALLPHLSRLVNLRFIFYKNSRFCDRMLHIVTHFPGRLFPRTAFQSLTTVVGDSGRFLTSSPLWDNFNMFFHVPSVTTIFGHQQRFPPNAHVVHEMESFITLAPNSSHVNTMAFFGSKRKARELIELVKACAAPKTLVLGFGNPEQVISPWELLDLTDLPMAARSTLECLVLAYREITSLGPYFFDHNISFSRPFTSFAALTSLKLGMIFIFDYRSLFSSGEQTPLEIARISGLHVEHKPSRLLPPRLEHLAIRRHINERYAPLLRNIKHVLTQRARFPRLKTLVVENMYVGARLTLACQELEEPSRFLNASMELHERAKGVGILFMNIDNCPK